MEQFAVFLLRVHLSFYTSYKTHRPHGTINHIPLGLIQVIKPPGPVEQLNILDYHLGLT